MPIEASYDRLAAEFEKVLRWFNKGMPKLDELLVEEPRPTSCADDFTGLNRRPSQCARHHDRETENTVAYLAATARRG